MQEAEERMSDLKDEFGNILGTLMYGFFWVWFSLYALLVFSFFNHAGKASGNTSEVFSFIGWQVK